MIQAFTAPNLECRKPSTDPAVPACAGALSHVALRLPCRSAGRIWSQHNEALKGRVTALCPWGLISELDWTDARDQDGTLETLQF